VSRLVPFELFAGRRLRIDGVVHSVQARQSREPFVLLLRDGGGTSMRVSRSELAALVVQERAELIDDLEDPDPVPSRAVTDISGLSFSRTVDWLGKMFLVRGLMHLTSSPKSPAYRQAFSLRLQELTGHLEEAGIVEFPGWSVWTVYHDILRMRKAGYDLSALQVKGVEYTPLVRRRDAAALSALRHDLERLALAEPSLSAAMLHRRLQASARSRTHVTGTDAAAPAEMSDA
jgi:hypothetical protein